MKQGSCDVVTSFWNVSAVSATETPLRFGVAAGFAGFLGCLWAVFVFFLDVDVSLADASTALAETSTVGAGRDEAPGSGSTILLGRDPGFAVSRRVSMEVLSRDMFFTPLKASSFLPSTYCMVVGYDCTPLSVQRS